MLGAAAPRRRRMDERINRVAALANITSYDSEATKRYVDGAPHIKHAHLRELYGRMVVKVFDTAKKHSITPRVLDLGAGEGSVTHSFLELGAQVTATDISASQLSALKSKCGHYGSNLDVRCEDMSDTLKRKSEQYDIVVMNSFLHHVPDYLGMIGEAVSILAPYGQFFSFQDPLRYDSISKPVLFFSNLAYFSWRAHQGDLWGGFNRRLRRARGIYLESSIHDNAEYHVTRNGVDQDAISDFFRARGFDCELIRYFSTQSNFFQSVGELLNIKNTFALVARNRG